VIEFRCKNTKKQKLLHIVLPIVLILFIIELLSENKPIYIENNDYSDTMEVLPMNEKTNLDIDSDSQEKKDQKEIRMKAEPVTPRHKVGRNEKCPCGSGKKFKHCCLTKLQKHII
jgi:preprotein translocase subunit SecA